MAEPDFLDESERMAKAMAKEAIEMMEILDEALTIVRELADEMPTSHDGPFHHSCAACFTGLAQSDKPETHTEDCLYARALKLKERLDAR